MIACDPEKLCRVCRDPNKLKAQYGISKTAGDAI